MITIAIDQLSTINRSEHSSNETKTHYSECHGVPSRREMCKGWFQVTLSEVGSVRRVWGISYIAAMCRQRHQSSEMNETQSYLTLYWLAISMRHCRHGSFFFFFSWLSHFPPFFFLFPSSGAPKGAPLQWRRKERFFFWGGEWREGDIRCSVPFDEALRMSNAVQLGSGPEGQGRGIRKLWYSALVCGLIVSFL